MDSIELQQCLPFTVLKQTKIFSEVCFDSFSVATVLTVYGIETQHYAQFLGLVLLQQCLPFTVLKRLQSGWMLSQCYLQVATVLTVYGIETRQCAPYAMET